MSRRRGARRYSLPAIGQSAPLNGSRVVPEGSDVFQKALEDLYLTDDKPKLVKQNSEPKKRGGIKGDIIEEDEDEYGNEEDYESEDADSSRRKFLSSARRFSSPPFLDESFTDQMDDKDGKGKQNLSVLLKKHNQFRKEYFVKHGHWPAANGSTTTPPRAGAAGKQAQKGTFDIVFGSTYNKKSASFDKT